VADRLKVDGFWDPAFDRQRRSWFRDTVALIRDRFHLLSDFSGPGRAYFSDTVAMDPAAYEKHLQRPEGLAPVLTAVADRIATIDSWDAPHLEALLKTILDETGIKAGVLVNAVRTAVTGSGKGPDFLSVLVAIGPDRVSTRLREAASAIS